MTDKFNISVDSESRIIHIRVWGFWSEEEAFGYREKLSEAMDSLGSGKSWDVLADVRLFPIQPAPVQKIHSKLMQRAVQMGMAKYANIVGGRLTRIQIERLSEAAWPEKGHFQFFNSRKDAESWLKENAHEFSEREDQRLIQTF